MSLYCWLNFGMRLCMMQFKFCMEKENKKTKHLKIEIANKNKFKLKDSI